jgi:hypothetical protein
VPTQASAASEADEEDDSVTAMAPLPEELRLGASRVHDEEAETITREKLPAEMIEAADKRRLERARLESHSGDDDDEGVTDVREEDVVTAIAPMKVSREGGVLPLRGDDSVTQDRPPIPSGARMQLPERSSAGLLGGFPSLSALPLPIPATAHLGTPAPVPVPHALPAVTAEDALGDTINADEIPGYIPPMPPPRAAPVGREQSFGSEIDLPPPPSYKRLGIVLGFAVVGARALLVFVIVRAATQGDVEGIAAIERRAKATHKLAWSDGDEQVSPATKKSLAVQQKKNDKPVPRRR